MCSIPKHSKVTSKFSSVTSGKDEFSWVQLSKVKFIFIMEHQEALKHSRQRKLVPDDKFDRHMKRARLQDIISRKQIFNEQTGDGIDRTEERRNIKSSIY